MKGSSALVVLALGGLVVAATACGGTTDVYFPTNGQGNAAAENPTYPDGSLTPEGCAVTSDRLCEILANRVGEPVDYERCRALTAYHNMQSFCVAKAQCLGRPYYDCMNQATTTDQAGVCAEEADSRCGLRDAGSPTARGGSLDGWVQHTSAGGFTIMMPSKPSPQSDALHGEYASGAPGSACGTGWSDARREYTDADLDSQILSLELAHASKKRITVLGKYRGLEIVGDNEKGQRIHSRVFSVGRRLFILMIINEADAAEASAFFESFQLR